MDAETILKIAIGVKKSMDNVIIDLEQDNALIDFEEPWGGEDNWDDGPIGGPNSE